MRKIIIHKVQCFGLTYPCERHDCLWLNGCVLGIREAVKLLMNKDIAHP